ncbi:magnesium transporter CorA family protein [Candidatus Enterococcus ikei]|uniref:Magnesium transporter CorA family protein n=1 Tax=Candidatus Enterococcus ikei TaxID=2815326 RepID=A0ABS3GW28_9ENTE|nr:magnesium transporter CorA family protein [Enterococcus sp. DIV0869a]MBO0439468.1 magnesium transporter CorA family protein [Enterococcus sp. DIV0869a]
MITEKKFGNGENVWININSDQVATDSDLYKQYGLDSEIISYALDKNERARIEYDNELDAFILIYNVPQNKKNNNHYEAVPMTFLIKNKQLLTITNNENTYIIEYMEKYLQNNSDISVFKFLFSSLFLITDKFFPVIEEMNKERNHINNMLKEKTTKTNLLALSDVETSVAYFISATKQNAVLLEQIKTNVIFQSLNEVEKEQWEDTLIEARQLVEMAQLTAQVLQQLSGTYNNILNNNLNDTMKILTVLSILLTIPTIVTGFFGMNMPLPLEHNLLGWVIAIGISLIGWFGLSFILRLILK